ncbi:hypothetical protein EN788_60620, partial [Mesorhizobium sp. M2D.F.Ca.ET.145.01.1.1]
AVFQAALRDAEACLGLVAAIGGGQEALWPKRCDAAKRRETRVEQKKHPRVWAFGLVWPWGPRGEGFLGVSRLPKEHLDSRQILSALKAFRNGDFSVRIENVYDGLSGEIADTFNQIVELNDQVT